MGLGPRMQQRLEDYRKANPDREPLADAVARINAEQSEVDQLRDAERALKKAARERGRGWHWYYCQITRTVLPRELDGKEAHTVCIDVNGHPNALRTREQADGKAYSAYWRMDFSSSPMLLGHFDDPKEAIDKCEETVKAVASGLMPS